MSVAYNTRRSIHVQRERPIYKKMLSSGSDPIV